MPRHVGLVVEPDLSRDLGGGHPASQQTASPVDPSRGEVAVRRDPVRLRKDTHEVTGVHSQLVGGLRDGEGLGEAVVEHRAQVPSERGIRQHWHHLAEPFTDERTEREDATLRSQLVSARSQRRVHLGKHPRAALVGDQRSRDTGPDGPRRQPGLFEIEHPFAKRASVYRSASVMSDVRGQQSDRARDRVVRIFVERVADRSLVDEQHGPHIVGVRLVGVVLERSVQHLAHERHGRMPRAHRLLHARNVQDSPVPTRHAGAVNEESTESETVRFDTKIVIVLLDGLLAWQELNVTAFLTSGIIASEDGIVGEPYADADGNEYLPMSRQPIVILSGSAEVLAAARSRALGRGIRPSIYTRELFATGHDAANRAAVAGFGAEALNLVGIGLRGPRNVVDRIVKGARMHD